ncbi:Ureohydrolase - like 2 [Theobroma cacao]|nr:Ureohydrolase - like 2 [Theobroma cacao]
MHGRPFDLHFHSPINLYLILSYLSRKLYITELSVSLSTHSLSVPPLIFLFKKTSNSSPFIANMSAIGRSRGIHYLQKLSAANIPSDLIEKGQSRVIDASLTLIREKAKLKGELVRALGGSLASTSLLGVPLGHNSSFLQGPAFAPPRIREAMWCGSTNSTTEEGKELKDPRVLTDVGDLAVQEIRDCGVDDDRLMNVVSESVKIVMEEVSFRLTLGFFLEKYYYDEL